MPINRCLVSLGRVPALQEKLQVHDFSSRSKMAILEEKNLRNNTSEMVPGKISFRRLNDSYLESQFA